MGTERDRVISITLTEAEYRAFVAAQPHPVAWLRERIIEAAQTIVRDEPAAESRQVAVA
jgi:hypothetical protein